MSKGEKKWLRLCQRRARVCAGGGCACVCLSGENKLAQVWPKRFVAISLLVHSTPLLFHSLLLLATPQSTLHSRLDKAKSKGGAKLFLLMHLSPFFPSECVCVRVQKTLPGLVPVKQLVWGGKIGAGLGNQEPRNPEGTLGNSWRAHFERPPA